MTVQTQKPTALFPDVPRQSPMIDKNGYITDIWGLFFDQLILSLQTNLKPEGFVIPPQTAANIALLIGTDNNPQSSYNNIVYDSTNNAFKGNIAGTWKTFTLT